MLTGWPMEGALPSTVMPSTMMTLQARTCKPFSAALQLQTPRKQADFPAQHRLTEPTVAGKSCQASAASAAQLTAG